MEITRAWAMPSKNTFSIKPINELIINKIKRKRLEKAIVGSTIIDPFANDSCLNHLCDFTNDIDPNARTTHHLDAIEFLQGFADKSVDLILFDPPYSPRQISECYKKFDKTVNMQTTQSSFWGNIKKEIARISAPKAVVITCGWNSGGIGKGMGFEIDKILLVAHGGWHNDTITTVEIKP